MAKKKGARIIVGLQCKECNATNYQTMLNKTNTGKLELQKYCKKEKKHTKHVSKEKLK
ncbi:MAG: 50S ribosomal protein L33 [candidate division SR1 bacterium CG_4_9_14_3_um_filter_40_9]|nr:MAG: 50S ribosomal protein L33 [candidate division SR1 bacterium CG_4_9_14_3_um_filter_40_9]